MYRQDYVHSSERCTCRILILIYIYCMCVSDVMCVCPRGSLHSALAHTSSACSQLLGSHLIKGFHIRLR